MKKLLLSPLERTDFLPEEKFLTLVSKKKTIIHARRKNFLYFIEKKLHAHPKKTNFPNENSFS